MRLKQTVQRYSLLIRLVTILLLFILIPLLLYIMWTTRSHYENYTASREQACLILLNQYEAAFRTNYESMRSVAGSLITDEHFVYETITAKPINVYNARLAMKNYDKRMRVGRFGLYYGGDILYTSDGTYSLVNYVRRLVGRTSQRALTDSELAVHDRLLNGLDVERADVRYMSAHGQSAASVNNRLLLMMPARVPGSTRATVCFELTPDMGLDGTLDKALGAMCYGILDRTGEALYLGDGALEEVLNTEEARAFARGDGVSLRLTLEGSSYALYRCENRAYGLQFLLLTGQIPSETSLDGMLSLLSNSVFSVTLLFALLCLVSAYLSYRPVKCLLRAVRGMEIVGAADESMSEMQTIYATLENVQCYYRELRDSASMQRGALVSNLLVNLIEGRRVDAGVLLRYGIVLNGPYFCVLLAYCEQSGVSVAHGAFTPLLREGMRLYCADSAYRGSAVFIANLDDGGREARERCALALKLALKREISVEARISVGSGVSDIDEIHISYLTANAACEQENPSRVVMFDDMAKRLSALKQFPSELVLKLVQYVKRGEKQRALDGLDDVLEAIRLNASTLIARQYMHMSLTNTLGGTLIDMGVEFSAEEIGRILNGGDTDSLRRTLTPVLERACDASIASVQAQTQRYEESIRRFVEDNIRNPDFNLAALSSAFEMAAHTMSRTFKKIFGMGFNEYLTVQRIEYAKEALIVCADKSIQEIALEAGYSNASYFNKVFKNVYGMTPTQFREG